MITVGTLEEDLKALKRGPAIGAEDLREDIGAALLRVLDLDRSAPAEELRSRLSAAIRRHAGRLAQHQQLAVLAAFGLHEEAQHRFLRDRLRWVLPKIDRDSVRTADRLVNKGITRIAQAMLAAWEARRRNPRVPTTWYTGSLDVVVRLDLDLPEYRERRVIIAREDGVREVPVASMAPKIADPDRADVAAEVVAGGKLVEWSRTAPTVYMGTLQLPAPLAAGERYEYELVYRTTPPELVQPVYLVTPVVQCDHLDLRVRFPVPAANVTVWLLDCVFRGTADDPLAEDVPTVPVDDEGWVRAEFDDLATGMTYGFRWNRPV